MSAVGPLRLIRCQKRQPTLKAENIARRHQQCRLVFPPLGLMLKLGLKSELQFGPERTGQNDYGYLYPKHSHIHNSFHLYFV